jgi:hypothetical protein
MSTHGGPQRPKLRPMEAQAVGNDGARYFVITDPRRVAKQPLLVREKLGPFMVHADDAMNVDAIVTVTRKRLPNSVDTGLGGEVEKELFERLDSLLLLEGGRYEIEGARSMDVYRTAEFRVPALEERAYPADPDDLLDLIEDFALDVSDDQQPSGGPLKAIVIPHIDYERGGDTYAELWIQAAPELKDVELAVVFGADHNGPGRGRH